MKKAQIGVTFNWIYVLIAGAVILLFFVGIVVRQKAVAEQELSTEVVRLMESIFAGASVSEKTKNVVSTGGLADYTLYFACEEGVGEFGLKGQPAAVQNSVDVLFAPLEIKSTQLVLFSLPYYLPFKVTDFLFVSSSNTLYAILGDGSPFQQELDKSLEPPAFNKKDFDSLDKIDPGKNFQVRVVDLNGVVRDGDGIPEKLLSLDEDKLTAVSFDSNQKFVDYYQMKEGVWKKLNAISIPIISLPDTERDAAKYAAVFAGSPEMYQCNMQKAFRRLKYLLEIYGGSDISSGVAGGKLQLLIDHYTSNPFVNCLDFLQNNPNNLLSSLQTEKNGVEACLINSASCSELIAPALKIQALNQELISNCVGLY